MSETNLIGKPLTPSVRVSTLDPHKITTPVPRPARGDAGSSDVNGARRPAGGQPIQPKTADIAIVRQPAVEHVTSSSSSKQTVIQQPATRRGTQPQREGLPGTTPHAHTKIPADQASLISDLLHSYRDGLPEDARQARELALRAIATIESLK